MSTNAYLIVSDLHVTEVEDHDDGWMRYKSTPLVFDSAFAALVDRFAADHAGRDLTLVLNGDIIDFDLVTSVPAAPAFPVRRRERAYGLDPTDAKSRWKLARILADHPVFVATLGRFVAAGHRIVYVLGNHDRELAFEGVQAVLRDSVVAAAAEAGAKDLDGARALAFAPWFHYVPGELYCEHGNQYDTWSSFRYVLATPVPEADGVVSVPLPMGNFANRYLLNRMGFFNPHAGDFMQSAAGYVAHWLRHYAFKKRGLIFRWMWGSILIFLGMIRNRARVRRQAPDLHLARRAELARDSGLAPEVVAALDGLMARPVNLHLFPILRELWLDRVVMALLMIGGTLALALASVPLWLKLMVPLVGFPLLYLIYELVVAQDINAYQRALPDRARRIARLVGVPVVAFGHTHEPMIVPLDPGHALVNTGTWAPTWETAELGPPGKPPPPTPGKRNYAIVDPKGGEHGVRLGSWQAQGRA
ncbi:MAG: metallophosphoesterase [Myxococcota bacterium]